MRKRPVLVRLLVPVVMLIGLACGPCNLFTSEMPTPPHPIAVSTESAAQLESRIQQNLGGEHGQQFILRMTDAEVTSLLAAELAKLDGSPVTNPQVWFTKGQIYGTGHLVNVLPLEADFYVVATPHFLTPPPPVFHPPSLAQFRVPRSATRVRRYPSLPPPASSSPDARGEYTFLPFPEAAP